MSFEPDENSHEEMVFFFNTLMKSGHKTTKATILRKSLYVIYQIGNSRKIVLVQQWKYY